MILESITIDNFRGFAKKREFTFERKALIMLTAPNGNGKTSLLDAIEWCLTGDIKRIHEVFDRRNTNAMERNKNKGAILKNENRLKDMTEVCLTLFDDKKGIYVINRTQSEDTLENKGNIQVNKLNGKQAEEELNNILDSKNFYKYHFCDMQKTFSFLTKSRDDMDDVFADFSSDYSEAENVVNNLILYIEDIKACIEEKSIERTIVEKTLIESEEWIAKHEASIGLIPYNTQKLFAGEQTDINAMTIEQLKNQLQKLYQCGYIHVFELLSIKQKSVSAEKVKKELEIIKKEIVEKGKIINEAIKEQVDKEETRTAAERELKKYSDIKLTKETLAGNKDEIIKLNNNNFTLAYWIDSNEKLRNIRESQEILKKEINTLSKGDEVLEILTSISNGKKGLESYRIKMRERDPEHLVLCPVCGSEQFGIINESDISKRAQEYQAEHKELIEQKKKKVSEIDKEIQKIEDEQLSKAEIVLKAAVDAAKEKVERLTYLYNETKDYFAALKLLQKADSKTFTKDRMMYADDVENEIINAEEKLLSQDNIVAIDTEVKQVLQNINYSAEEELTDDGLLAEVKRRIKNAPTDVQYDENLLYGKISAVRSYINNSEYLESKQKISNSIQKKSEIEAEINSLNELKDKANKKIKNITETKTALKTEEYQQVGPYLYKIFCKLSRDVKISGIIIENVKGSKTSLMDDKKNSLLNILSDGQLSVFMLSYFLGNIFRMRDSESCPIYFIDDITSCMDDINMLAFLDLIKYQLLDPNRAMKQIFFATCDERIKNLLEYKLGNCGLGLGYKEIGIKDFQNTLG